MIQTFFQVVINLKVECLIDKEFGYVREWLTYATGAI